MEISVSPALSDDDTELLEGELGQIAHELCIEGVDIAGIVEEGMDGIRSLELFYEDERPDDDELAGFAGEILDEFNRLHSEGSSFTKDFAVVLKRVGRIALRLVR